jgi:hypothetical protein
MADEKRRTVIMLYSSDSKDQLEIVLLSCTIMLILFFIAMLFGKAIASGNSDDPSFPTYGKGKINVRIFTDYFCPPCRASEPELEPLIENLVKKGLIKVTFVDTPTTRNSPLYVKHFLYALKKRNDFPYAMYVRRALFEAAKNRITDQGKLQTYLGENDISFTVFDVKPIFGILNSYLKNDNVRGTPSCVIEKNGNIEKATGGQAMLNALRALQ